VGAPVFDHTGRAKYAMSISCPTMRLSMDGVEAMQLRIREACKRMSEQLGYKYNEDKLTA
jgi:DNA-binding IclR family transcriptional regulator